MNLQLNLKILILIILFNSSVFGQSPELIIPVGHTSDISSIDVSSNMKYMVSCSKDKSIILWDFVNGDVIRKFSVFPEIVSNVCFSNDDKYILASVGKKAILYDIASFDTVKTFTGHKYYIKCAIFSPDGKYILTGSADNTIKLWDTETTEELRTYLGHIREVNTLCFTPDGENFMSGSDEGSIKYWSIYSSIPISTLKGHDNRVTSIDISPDGILAASGSWDKNIIIWNIASGDSIKKFTRHRNWINDVKFTPDGKYIASATLYFNQNQDTTIRIWNINEMKEDTCKYNFEITGNNVCFSPDGKYILAEGLSNDIEKYDVINKKKILSFSGKTLELNYASFSNDGKYFVAASFINPQIWDISNATVKKYLGINKKPPHFTNFSKLQFEVSEVYYIPGSQLVLSLGQSFWLWNSDSEDVVKKFSYHRLHSLRFSNDNTLFLVCDSNKVIVYSLSSYEKVITLKADEKLNSANFSPDGNNIIGGYGSYLGSTRDGIIVWDAHNGEKINKKFKNSNEVIDVSYSPDGKYIVSAGSDLILWDAGSGKKIHEFGLYKNGWKTHVIFTSDGKYLLVGGDFGLSLIDMNDFSEKIRYEGISGYIKSISIDKKNERILACSEDGSVILWDIINAMPIVTFVQLNFFDNFTITPEQYYLASKNSISKLSFRINGTEVYPVEQFDLQYNRPDKVLERIGLADSSLINAYYLAYLKRLKKMKFTEEMFASDFHLPETVIINSDSLPVTTNYSKSTLQIKVTDSKYKLDRINILINDVPVYGMDGIDLRLLKTDSVIKEIPIELSQGENKIQVSCLNEKGVESYKEAIWIKYEPEKSVQSNLYLYTIGVSEYQDKEFNLKYAAKDGRDLVHLFDSLRTSWDTVREVYFDTLFNASATKENILALKQKLMNTKIDDEVILYVSGHGLLDDSLDFYFATYNMNFDKPAEYGILYDDMEGLLDSIPARKKLLLMDACHSGEVDKDDHYISVSDTTKETAQNNTHEKGSPRIKYIGSKSKLGLQNSFELMQELFANLSRGSGAVVISAAQGAKSALESSEWNNGAFTYCIINGLKTNAADADKDGSITVSELKEYISTEVEKITNGKQKPTSRRESLEFDWKVW